MTELTSLPWRAGRTLGRTMYARTGGGDWKADTAFGMLDTPELAGRACAGHNAMLDLSWLLAAGLDVRLGIYDTPEGPCYSAVLSDADTPHLADFEGYATLGDALTEAREWAEGMGITP